MSRHLLLVALGAAIGGVARYLLTGSFTKLFPSSFPYGTFVVNLLGCLIIGVFYGLSEHFEFTSEWRVFLTTGLCGGFTTFSAFAYENVRLLQSGQYVTFGLYSTSSFVLGILGVLLGLSLTRLLTT